MNDMIIPEEIYFVTPAMYPITLEIDNKKCNDINENSSFYMDQRDIICQPAISKNRNPNTKYVLDNICHSAAKTWDTVKSADNIRSFPPFNDFFNKEEKQEKGDSDI